MKELKIKCYELYEQGIIPSLVLIGWDISNKIIEDLGVKNISSINKINIDDFCLSIIIMNAPGLLEVYGKELL